MLVLTSMSVSRNQLLPWIDQVLLLGFFGILSCWDTFIFIIFLILPKINWVVYLINVFPFLAGNIEEQTDWNDLVSTLVANTLMEIPLKHTLVQFKHRKVTRGSHISFLTFWQSEEKQLCEQLAERFNIDKTTIDFLSYIHLIRIEIYLTERQ